MLVSIVAVLLFMAGLLGLMLFPKTEGRMNGCKMIVMGTMAIFCYLAFCAKIYYWRGIFVGLPSTCASLVLMNAILWGAIVYKKKVQKLFWRASDIISLLFLIAFVLWISMEIFSSGLALQYRNIDAAEHFKYAMRIVFYGILDRPVYFSAYIDAMIIDLFVPMLSSEVLYFKGFIVADIFMHVLEICMFYCLVLTVSDKKIVRVFAPVFSIGYFFGYPTYSFMEGNFVYWSNGVMILIFLVYALLLFEKYERLHRYIVPLLLLGLYANFWCHKLFIPVNTLAFFLILTAICVKNYKRKINKKIFLGILGGIAILAMFVGLIYLGKWGGTLANLTEKFRAGGAMYRSMYSDLIFFVPAFIYVCYWVIGKKKGSLTICLLSWYMLAVTIGMYILWYNYIISFYYYYKIYYNMWLCGWLLVVLALHLMSENRQLSAFCSYAGMVGLLCWISLSDYDVKMWVHNPYYNGQYAMSQMFPLYRYNMDLILEDYAQYRISNYTIEAYHQALEVYIDDTVTMVSSDWDKLAWYVAMARRIYGGYHFDEYELFDLLRDLDERQVSTILILREDPKYEIYQQYFGQCTVLFENEDALILKPTGEKWLEVPEGEWTESEKKLELFSYVTESLSEENVPLMASQKAYYDFMMYYEVTGNDSSEFYVKPYDTTGNIENLNEHNVHFVVLLYSDSYYQENKEYYDAYPVLYENEAGKVVWCGGDEWLTDYGELMEMKQQNTRGEGN